MSSSGLKGTSLAVWHRLLLKVLTFDLALKPLFLYKLLPAGVLFFAITPL
jgi:hypothetical protein